MHQQVGNYKYRVVVLLSDIYFHHRAVLLRNHSVKCKRDCNPLVFLDTAIVMGIQIGKLIVLIQRVLLDVDTRGIDVGAQYVHSCLERLLPNMEDCDCLIHTHGIYLVACFKRLFRFLHCFQRLISFLLKPLHSSIDAFPLCLTFVQTQLVLVVYLLQFLQCSRRIRSPFVFLTHNYTSSICFYFCPVHETAHVSYSIRRMSASQ